MNNQPLVSILIPLYNQERYFEKCISSICNQTYKNLEIVVVNDGSTDKSPEILSKWASKDQRIKVVNKKNEGLVAARRDGFLAATGEFVTPVDSDDYLPADSIEILVGHMTSKNVDIVLGSRTQVLGFIKRSNYGDNGTFPFHQVVTKPELFDKYYLNFFGKNYFSVMIHANLYRKSVVDKALRHTNLFCDEICFVGEDLYFFMTLFPYIDSMYRTDETVYYYRCGGASSDHFSPTYPALFYLSDERLKLLDHYGLHDGYESLFVEYANCLYYHAQQLLEYKKTDKNGVVQFFKQELATRQLFPRMKEFFSKNRTSNRSIQLLINSDYEGMYNYANALMLKRCKSVKQRCKKILIRFCTFLEF